MLYILSQIAGWIATFFRASGMLAKKPMTVKWLVSIGMLAGVLRYTNWQYTFNSKQCYLSNCYGRRNYKK